MKFLEKLTKETTAIGYCACVNSGDMFYKGDARFVSDTEYNLKNYLSQYDGKENLYIKKIRFSKIFQDMRNNYSFDREELNG